jgi:hypothetical protein
MLSAQMAAIHIALMKVSRGPSLSKKIPQLDSAQLVKLARTYATQMETFNRYQTGGAHTVQNVSVSCGRQAIFAHVTQPASESMPRMAGESFPAGGEHNGISAPIDAGHQHLNGAVVPDVVQPAEGEGDRGLANASSDRRGHGSGTANE